MAYYNQHFTFINNISNNTLLQFSTIWTRIREYLKTVPHQMFQNRQFITAFQLLMLLAEMFFLL